MPDESCDGGDVGLCEWESIDAPLEFSGEPDLPGPIPPNDYLWRGQSPVAGYGADGTLHVAYSDHYFSEGVGPEGEDVEVHRRSILGSYANDVWIEDRVFQSPITKMAVADSTVFLAIPAPPDPGVYRCLAESCSAWTAPSWDGGVTITASDPALLSVLGYVNSALEYGELAGQDGRVLVRLECAGVFSALGATSAAEGDLHLAWIGARSQETLGLYYAIRTAGSFATEEVACVPMPAQLVQMSQPSIALDASGDPHLCWVHGALEPGSTATTYARRQDDQWEFSVLDEARSCNLGADEFGRIHMQRGDSYTILEDGQWSPEVVIPGAPGPSDGSAVAFAVSVDGTAALLWSDKDTLWLSTNASGDWETTALVSS